MNDSFFMKTHIRRGQICVSGLACFVLLSCTSISDDRTSKSTNDAKAAQNISYANATSQASSIDANQIGEQTSSLAAPQVQSKVDTDKLTVEQLLNYVDRCSPKEGVSVPAGLDCSEVNLRVQRMIRADDRVKNALITLDRIGRNASDESLDDLKKGRPGSLTSQAIAGGILDPVTPLSAEPENELLDSIGIPISTGAVVTTQR